jgi:hypothetical protein
MRSTAPGYAYAYYPSSTSMFSVASDVHLNPSYDRLGDTNGFQNPAGEHGLRILDTTKSATPSASSIRTTVAKPAQRRRQPHEHRDVVTSSTANRPARRWDTT